MSAWSGQVRVDIQLISWNAFCYSQLRRLTGSNLLTFFLTYLLTFFLTYLLMYLLTFFLTYLLTFFLPYLAIFFLTYLLNFFLTYRLTYLSDISFHMLSDISSDILSDISKTNNIHDNFVPVKRQFYSCIQLHQTAQLIPFFWQPAARVRVPRGSPFSQVSYAKRSIPRSWKATKHSQSLARTMNELIKQIRKTKKSSEECVRDERSIPDSRHQWCM